MRSLLLLLLILNLGYLGWNMIRPPAGDRLIDSEYGAARIPGITLVSELGSESPATAAPAEQSETADDSAPDPAGHCVAVGLFRDAADAEAFLELARGLSLEAELGEAEPPPPQYRVYLPPAASREEAAAMAEELTRRAVEAGVEAESYVITRGDLENGVALGLFNDPRNAETVVERVGKLGFDARVSTVQESGAPLVVIKNLQNERLAPWVWSHLTGDKAYLTQTQNVCETIAQGR